MWRPITPSGHTCPWCLVTALSVEAGGVDGNGWLENCSWGALLFAVCPLCTLCSHGASARDQAWRAKTRKQLEPDTEPRARIQATAPGCPLLGPGAHCMKTLVTS